MRKAYTSLYSLNMQLISQYKSRAITHDTLLKGLKSVNLMVQRASNLRVGKAKQDVITSCRQAVKNNNMKALKRIIKYGNVSNNT
jgi:Bardet-Biedl syndrome 2 protein